MIAHTFKNARGQANKNARGQAKTSMASSVSGVSINLSAMAQTTLATRPLVTVVTPFYNTAPHLAQCIESVLAQSYREFEYILMDNCSTDGSSEIARSYERLDPRIRLIRCSEFLSQLANYNRALAEISEASLYCKIVQADDYIYPECLQLMVQAFDQSQSIGLVSSYRLMGNTVAGSGYPCRTAMLPGRECGRWFLRTGINIFGSQTTVMYRSSVVRSHNPFYDESLPHADLEKCIEILQHWDFGFVYQVLSFTRTENESILHQVLLPMAAHPLAQYVIAQRYSAIFVGVNESASIIAQYKLQYYRALARAALRLRGRAFWRFHKVGLKALGEHEKHDWPYLALIIGTELLWLASNPGMTTVEALRGLKPKIGSKRGAPSLGSLPADLVSPPKLSLEGVHYARQQCELPHDAPAHAIADAKAAPLDLNRAALQRLATSKGP
jgi:glycosyltransferase involved in cell wall biosynthesis